VIKSRRIERDMRNAWRISVKKPQGKGDLEG